MSLNRRQKRLVITFAVGATALLVDRLFLRPNGGATDVSAGSQRAAEILAAADNLPALESESPEFQIALRLDRLLTGDDPDFAAMRNPFSTPKSWSDTEGPVAERTDSPFDVFVRRHRLTAVGELGPEGGVLLDGHFLALGRKIDGFSLVSIGKRTAVFERDGRQVTLKLASDP